MNRFRGGDKGAGRSGGDRRTGSSRRSGGDEKTSTRGSFGNSSSSGRRSSAEVRNGRSLADVIERAGAVDRAKPPERERSPIQTRTQQTTSVGRSGRAIEYQPVLSFPNFGRSESTVRSEGTKLPVRVDDNSNLSTHEKRPSETKSPLQDPSLTPVTSNAARGGLSGKPLSVDPGWPHSRSLGGAQSLVQVGRAVVGTPGSAAGSSPSAVEKVRKENGRMWVTGIVKRHPDGFGFLIPDESAIPDVYISRQYMAGVMTNDRVEVEVFRTRGHERSVARSRERVSAEEKMYGEVKRILSRAYSRVVGRFLPVDRRYGVIQDDGFGWGMDLRIPTEDSMGARDGDWVAAEITEYGGNQAPLIGRVVQILGDIEDPIHDVDRVVHEKGIPREFSPSTLQEVSRFGSEVKQVDCEGREDLRPLSLITIDGATARDFDDAIYVERSRDGYRLIVAIADVSHYVKPGTALDEDAYNRGTSVYFPNAVVPMLPEELSNELCSLKPHVDRLCFACEMVIDRDGVIQQSRFFEGVMRSKARVTYGEAQELIDGAPSEALKKQPEVCGSIILAAELAQILMEKRMAEGSLDLEVGESTVVVDPSGETIDVVRAERLFAHRLIEELMLVTNISTARFFSQHNLHGIYRIHESPRLENIKALEKMMWNILGPRFKSNLLGAAGRGGAKEGRGRSRSKSSHGGRQGYADSDEMTIPVVGSGLQSRLSEALKLARQQPGGEVLSSLALRSMNQAKYSADNIGHFGLGFSHYSHFTSPIRRYPDLIAHRLIKAVLVARYRNQGMEPEEVATAATHLSACEQRAVKAERAVVSIKKARFIRRYVGEVLDGAVSSVTKFGIFVTLRKFDVDGLVKLEALGADRWVYDEQSMRLFGRRTGRVFRLGDEVSVIVVAADVATGKIDFQLADFVSDVATVEPAEILFEDEINDQIQRPKRGAFKRRDTDVKIKPKEKSKSSGRRQSPETSNTDRNVSQSSKSPRRSQQKGRGRKR